ncbi:2-isopropylmalate synthase, partial [Frankliniella fusca]
MGNANSSSAAVDEDGHEHHEEALEQPQPDNTGRRLMDLLCVVQRGWSQVRDSVDELGTLTRGTLRRHRGAPDTASPETLTDRAPDRPGGDGERRHHYKQRREVARSVTFSAGQHDARRVLPEPALRRCDSHDTRYALGLPAPHAPRGPRPAPRPAPRPCRVWDARSLRSLTEDALTDAELELDLP